MLAFHRQGYYGPERKKELPRLQSKSDIDWLECRPPDSWDPCSKPKAWPWKEQSAVQGEFLLLHLAIHLDVILRPKYFINATYSHKLTCTLLGDVLHAYKFILSLPIC